MDWILDNVRWLWFLACMLIGSGGLAGFLVYLGRENTDKTGVLSDTQTAIVLISLATLGGIFMIGVLGLLIFLGAKILTLCVI